MWPDMAREIRLWVSDDAVVAVTSGTEYGERQETLISTDNANRVEIMERAREAIALLGGHITDIQAELAAWPGKDAAAVKTSLGGEIIPALVYALKVERQVVRLLVSDTSAVD